MAVGRDLVGDSRGNVECDDGALALDVIAVAQTAELLHSGGVLHIESDGTSVGVKDRRMRLHAQCGHVPLRNLAGHVTLHESCVSGFLINQVSKALCSATQRIKPSSSSTCRF
ncbi:hypothetical protein KR084_012339 [Drosophila pseudotakahashii]|nr:hypothetical protein KR084_012339 [Drosophila pseudotakahashii]